MSDQVINRAYMVVASLVGTRKVWAALRLPEGPWRAEGHQSERRSWLRMVFATYREPVLAMPCQFVRGGERLVYRLLSWTPWPGAWLRLVERPRSCWLY
jgi:hypothetical protein